MLLGKARAHGAVEGLAATLHTILIPGRASAVRVWVGATVAGPRSLTGGHGCSGGHAWDDAAATLGLANTKLRWVTDDLAQAVWHVPAHCCEVIWWALHTMRTQ
jgi:hypothetical protein